MWFNKRTEHLKDCFALIEITSAARPRTHVCRVKKEKSKQSYTQQLATWHCHNKCRHSILRNSQNGLSQTLIVQYVEACDTDWQITFLHILSTLNYCIKLCFIRRRNNYWGKKNKRRTHLRLDERIAVHTEIRHQTNPGEFVVHTALHTGGHHENNGGETKGHHHGGPFGPANGPQLHGVEKTQKSVLATAEE